MQEFRELIHGGDLVTSMERYSRRNLIDFSANINPMGLPEGVKEAFLQSVQACTHYPDALCRELRAAIAEYESVPVDWVLCGNGAADLIYRIAMALAPRQGLLLAPTFAEYEEALRENGCALHFHLLREEDNFAVGEGIFQAIPGNDLVFLCNPNNPTGQLMSRDFLERILEACTNAGAILVVDECFLDFLTDEPQYTLKPFLKSNANLIVLRAFTKIFAMPGLRLGYALCGNHELLRRVDRAGAPWSVSTPAQLCGVAAVKELEYVVQSRKLVAEERIYLEQELSALGLRVYPSCVNYIMFYTPDPDFAHKLGEKGVVLRDCSNYRGLGSGYFRTAVRTRAENTILINAIKEL